MTPAIRPIRFSALKALDPLHKEEERSENYDRQPDIDEVEHGALQGFLLVCAPGPATRSGEAVAGGLLRHFSGGGQDLVRSPTDSVKPQETGKSPVQTGPMRGPCGS
jgi:hypothetical protein